MTRHRRYAAMAAVAATVVAASALGEHVMRLPSKSAQERIDSVRMDEPFSSGRLTFRVVNPASKAVYSVYETSLTPAAALDEIAMGLEAAGWKAVNETASLTIFEAKNGKCAVAMAYERNGTTIAAVLIQ